MGRIYRLILLAFVSLFVLAQVQVYSAEEQETFFVVTAYYSPLPGQAKYYNGTYEAEIYINGKGTHGASGKAVFEGMLAAPKNYPFGTKIYFEGYGIAEVQDRGGAIVNAGQRGHSHDRIDIWMGYGDDGRNRAIQWGTRTVKGKIVPSHSENTIQFGKSEIGDIGNLKVSPESGPLEVKQLQEIFTKANLYDGEIDGKYQSIKQELIDFQVSRGVISDSNAYDAGYVGNKTTTALRKEFSIESPLAQEELTGFKEFAGQEQSPEYKLIITYGKLEVNPDSQSNDIKSLQKLLQGLGKYNGKIDGKYSSIEGPLIDLQIEIGVADNRDDWGAGYYGNKTKTALLRYYEQTPNTETLGVLPTEPSLSSSEKKKLDGTIIELRKAIVRIADKSGKSPRGLTDKLKQDIENVLPKITKPTLKLKLKYIAENL